MTVTREGNEIIGKRTFDAPIQQVFNAYTTKEKFEQWFFPKGGGRYKSLNLIQKQVERISLK
ncbi:SRPBCC domain-containing protein [Staphylococcus simulans]|uniref:SRPBCC family protein n=1 Tax=Staphylococcus simulans TaxID=1286 RepID=UPI00255708DC|nr:SRPBCC domain-containing protein [Staphylococcus simulans]MDK8175820.1 SRPBCC domain-containing protein [Staphylococcus simulans]